MAITSQSGKGQSAPIADCPGGLFENPEDTYQRENGPFVEALPPLVIFLSGRVTTRLKVRAGQIDNLGKTVRIMDSDLSQRFTIELNQCLLQSRNQLAIAEAAHAAGSIDTDNPESAKLAFAYPSITERINTTSDQGYLRLANKIMPA